MAKKSKKQQDIEKKVDLRVPYTLEEACETLKDVSFENFDASVDVDVRLGVDPKKPDQMVRGTVSLPNGTGKDLKVLALVTPEKEQEAIDAGADYVGLDDYIEQIEQGWYDVDVIITLPTVMSKIGKLGKVLGPRGLMPNPKSGTVTMEIGKAVQEFKAGKVDFKVDKYGIVHSSVGKSSFTPEQLKENLQEFVQTIYRIKPSGAKGEYFRTIHVSTTMSPGIEIDKSSIPGII